MTSVGLAAGAANRSGPQFTGTWLAETELVRVGGWSCNPDVTPAWSPSRVQSWPLVTFCHDGAFKVGSSRRADLVDRAACMVVAGEREYSTFRLVHGEGHDVAIRPDVFDEIRNRSSRGRSGTDGGIGVDRLSRPLSAEAVLYEAHVSAAVRPSSAPRASDLLLEERVLRLAGSILQPSWSTPAGESDRRVDSARAHLAEFFTERVTLAAVAATARISPFHLCRLFRSSVGMSLHRYQTRLRLFSAVRELVDPGCSLADLAVRLGFSHQSHLGEAFRREFGMTPSKARRSLAAGRLCLDQVREAPGPHRIRDAERAV